MRGHRHRFERYGTDGPFGDRTGTGTGNGIVKNGPENELGGLAQGPEKDESVAGSVDRPESGSASEPEREPELASKSEPASEPVAEPASGSEPGSGSGSGEGSGPGDDPGPGLGGDEGDEEALRRLLRGAVDDLMPSEVALDHLRKAVPARRARKRQALVGMAAAALLIGTAVPAFVHVASSNGGDGSRSVNAGHGEEAQGGTDAKPGDAGGNKGVGGPVSNDPDSKPDKGQATSTPDSAAVTGGTNTGSGDAAGGASAKDPTPPPCNGNQLGISSAEANQPDAEGKVYGTFRISNVSERTCEVTGSGTVGFQAQGAADSVAITVVEHTSGDAASGLPDPSQEVGTLLLKPEMAYAVKFAWVPTDSCPMTGTSPSPTPSDGGSGASNGTTGTGGDNTQTQLGVEDGGTADGSVAVTHTAEPGAPTAETTIHNACAGTIYRTGVLGES